MPFDPNAVGNKLIIVGDKQIETSDNLLLYSEKLLVVGGTLKNDQKISLSLKSIEDGTRAVRTLIGLVVGAFRSISSKLSTISIMKIAYEKKSVTIPIINKKITYVSGLSLTTFNPLSVVVTYFNIIADKLEVVQESLKSIADALKTIKAELPKTGTTLINAAKDMEETSKDMEESGKAMKEAGTLLATP